MIWHCDDCGHMSRFPADFVSEDGKHTTCRGGCPVYSDDLEIVEEDQYGE